MIKTIIRDELIKIINSGRKLKLLDVLTPESYANEHIKGALSLPLADIEKDAGKILKKDDLITTYCASFDCPASTKAAQKLMALGYQNVFDYKGGLKDYKEAGLPLEGSLHNTAEAKKSGCSSCG